MTKPFSPRELTARVRALLRRTAGHQEPPALLRRGELAIDLERREVTCGDKPVELTATEFRLLHFLASHPGRVFSRGELIDHVLGRDVEVLDRTVDVHVMAVRKKLGKHGELVETVRGFGYRFREEEDSQYKSGEILKGRLFWKFSSMHLVLFLLVLLAVDTYVVRSLRQRVSRQRPWGNCSPCPGSRKAALRNPRMGRCSKSGPAGWGAPGPASRWLARTARCWRIPRKTPSRWTTIPAGRRYGRRWSTGTGRAVRYSATIGHDLVYLAVRQQAGDGSPLIIRYAVPLERLAEALAGFRSGLWAVSLVILVLAGGSLSPVPPGSCRTD